MWACIYTPLQFLKAFWKYFFVIYMFVFCLSCTVNGISWMTLQQVKYLAFVWSWHWLSFGMRRIDTWEFFQLKEDSLCLSPCQLLWGTAWDFLQTPLWRRHDMTCTPVHWHWNLSVERHTLMRVLPCPQKDTRLDKHTQETAVSTLPPPV